MNCHTHVHIIVIDGVYTRQQGGTTRFQLVEPPSAVELAKMVEAICERVCRMLGRRRAGKLAIRRLATRDWHVELPDPDILHSHSVLLGSILIDRTPTNYDLVDPPAPDL